jgi:hypothetical protein
MINDIVMQNKFKVVMVIIFGDTKNNLISLNPVIKILISVIFFFRVNCSVLFFGKFLLVECYVFRFMVDIPVNNGTFIIESKII